MPYQSETHLPVSQSKGRGVPPKLFQTTYNYHHLRLRGRKLIGKSSTGERKITYPISEIVICKKFNKEMEIKRRKKYSLTYKTRANNHTL
ncbi:hypothetical protein Nepgr_027051 [Nepenthes gracilis]|uniref:Uncharacterized protein n=1 Tax=Nepenthes gracilis TaxID=150966 RepID=A0AAD3T9P3_NEPGR|nr:hypothetical protein Nepgr_027051 [Nepenthes gracilis]